MVIWFDAPGCVDVAIAGGKGASLARMTALGMPVPPGFVVSAGALAASETPGELPEELARAIRDAYRGLGDDVPVAVRSSATAEDSRAASFAGQHETYLHVRGADRVLERIRDCWASRSSERALSYRARSGAPEGLGMAVIVQRMVEPDVAGVLFTIDPVHNRRDRMVVEAALGLGEAVVSGRVTPDHYVLGRDGGLRSMRLAESPGALNEQQLSRLARVGRELEARLGGPQDVERAIRGDDLHLLQSRPVTTYGQPNPT